MTLPKPKSEWKQRQKPELVGPSFKLCEACGARIERGTTPNMAWTRKRACSNACNYRLIAESNWKRRMESHG
jgi:hypothetical protein